MEVTADRQRMSHKTSKLMQSVVDSLTWFRYSPRSKMYTMYTLFSSAHGTFSRINHMLGHKTSLNKFERMEIISTVFFFDHNGMKPEINYRKKRGKEQTFAD